MLGGFDWLHLALLAGEAMQAHSPWNQELVCMRVCVFVREFLVHAWGQESLV